MATRDELVAVAGERYRRSVRRERGRILDEFTALTGFHRKHAMRLLRSSARSDRNGARPQRRIYGEAVRETLIILWETSVTGTPPPPRLRRPAERDLGFNSTM